MAFPVVEATNESATTGTTSADHTVNLPTGIQAGDLLLVIMAKGRAVANWTVNAETGWTELADEAVAGGAYVAWRKADGTEGATNVWTASGNDRSAEITYRISGATDPTVQPPEISTVATGTSQAPDPNTVTPTGGAKDYLWITFFVTTSGEEADDDTWTNNAATNYGSLLQKTSGTGGTNVGACVASCVRTNNAASEDAVWPAASLDASLGWRAFTIAVHPGPITGTVAITQDAQTSSASGTSTAPANPVFGSAGTQLQGSGSTMNVDVPDDVAAGDIIVVTAFVDTAGATVTGLPSGFAQAPDSPVGPADNHSLYVMWKRATGADSTAGTYDFTLSASVYRNAQAIRYTGAVSSGDPWDVTNSNHSGTNNVSTTPAVSDTTTVSDTLLVWAATNWSGGSWTPPTSFTERRDTGDGVCTVADLAQAAAGATGSITGTSTSTDKSCAWLGALSASAGAVTGTVAETQDAQTSSATGGLGYTGTVAETQADQTSAASGTVSGAGVTGTVAETQDNQTSTATSVLGYSGTVARTQADQTSSATGILGYSGTSARTQANQTATASGTVSGIGEVSGSLAETQDSQTSSATGVLGYTGTAAHTQANQTATASGWITITGGVAETQDPQISSAAGNTGLTGTAAGIQANQTATAAGWITVTGLVARTQADQTATGTGFFGEIPIPAGWALTVSGDSSELTVPPGSHRVEVT